MKPKTIFHYSVFNESYKPILTTSQAGSTVYVQDIDRHYIWKPATGGWKQFAFEGGTGLPIDGLKIGDIENLSSALNQKMSFSEDGPVAETAGEAHMNTATGEVYSKTAAGWKLTYSPSLHNGSVFIVSKNDPTAEDGKVGDMFLNRSLSTVFGTKTKKGWGKGFSLMGAEGAKGATGIQGVEGKQGPAGIKGPQGFRGPIGKLGEKGIQGDHGKVGKTGAQGGQGVQGEVGIPGPVGPIGQTGPAGKVGAQGVQGEPGYKGLKGDAGKSIVGAKGEAGPKGEAGDKGASGKNGRSFTVAGRAEAKEMFKASAEMFSLGEVWISSTDEPTYGVVKNDALLFSGTEAKRINWTNLGPLVGPKGDTGLLGLPGKAGKDGNKGSKGDIGVVGQTGAKGNTGAVGDDGAIGPKGDVGMTGLVGSTGQTGPQGVPGAIGASGLQGVQGPSGVQGVQGEPGSSSKFEVMSKEAYNKLSVIDNDTLYIFI